MAKNRYDLVVDLHSHSDYSDGILTPSDLVKRASGKGVKYLALTDHHSIGGIEEAIAEGKRQGVEIIPGIELKFLGGEVLGYYVDPESKILKNYLERISERSVRKAEALSEALKLNGHKVSIGVLNDEFPHAKDNLNMMHFCYHFYKKGKWESISETWDGLIENLKYSSFKLPNVYDCIKVIKDAGGVPVLAHPWITKTSKGLLEEENIRKLIAAGLQGIEMDQGDRREDRSDEILERIRHLGEKYNLLITSGSDFHGDFLIDPHESSRNHEVGAHNCDLSLVGELKERRSEFQQATLD